MAGPGYYLWLTVQQPWSFENPTSYPQLLSELNVRRWNAEACVEVS